VAGTLSEDTCCQRVQKLGGTIAELRVRQDDLRAALDATNIQPPTHRQLADLDLGLCGAPRGTRTPTARSVAQCQPEDWCSRVKAPQVRSGGKVERSSAGRVIDRVIDRDALA
jgi:hypothetical protein